MGVWIYQQAHYKVAANTMTKMLGKSILCCSEVSFIGWKYKDILT